MTGERLLVPVSDSDSLRNTVAHVLQEESERGDHDTSAVHFVYPLAERVTADPDSEELEAAHTLLDRVAVWAEEDLDEDTDAVSVETAVIGDREYLFSPGDYADVLAAYAREHDLDVAVFDPGYDPLGVTPLLPPLETEIERLGLDVEQAPVQRGRRSPLLVRRSTGLQFLALFGISYLFYLALAGSVALFELVTGAISGAVVATTLWGVSLTTPVRPLQGLRTLLRFALYVPYLLWEVLKANLVVAYVVLHPDLPIDPAMVEFDAAVWSVLPVAVLANSITLTPGTLTVDVSRRQFTVHTLTRGSRDGLLSGSLERAVRFVFYGLRAARIQSPIERREQQLDADERETS